ncbi:MAG: DUF692 domain-containing protein [Gammaproteobacteria bacterium]|nr:DUF692 domain-containing protein [Gammaproteobacteria bacterium]
MLAGAQRYPAEPIPVRSGIGLRAAHYRDILEQRPAIGWLEAHSENYFGAGGAPLRYLEELRVHYPLSLHGVGLSLGSADELNSTHIKKLRHLIDLFEPALVSEHLSWSSIDGTYFNDLLPLPYTDEALRHLAPRIALAQDLLGRQLLIENPSNYLRFHESLLSEPQFLTELVTRTGCGLLLDVNNVYVSACNLQFDAHDYLRALPASAVQEIHLAGHAVNDIDSCTQILIDDHGDRVCDAVWQLFEFCLRVTGPRPTLIEWDTRIPTLDTLVGEAHKADQMLERVSARVA